MGLNLSLRGNVWYVIGTMTRADGKSVRVKRSTKFTLNQKSYASNVLSKVQSEIFNQTDDVKSKVRSDDTVAEMLRRYETRSNGIGQADRYTIKRFDALFGKRKTSRSCSLPTSTVDLG